MTPTGLNYYYKILEEKSGPDRKVVTVLRTDSHPVIDHLWTFMSRKNVPAPLITKIIEMSGVRKTAVTGRCCKEGIFQIERYKGEDLRMSHRVYSGCYLRQCSVRCRGDYIVRGSDDVLAPAQSTESYNRDCLDEMWNDYLIVN